MSEPQPPVSFAETVYALSKVHVVKYCNDTSESLNDHQRKHLRLLDDIALFLVTDSKSDVAAVSLERISSGVRFYYAKNRPETDDDRKHIDALRDLVRGTGDATERIDGILYRVIDDCRPKLLSRLQKLKRTLQHNQASPEPFLFGDQEGELHEYYRINFNTWYEAYPTATELLADFLAEIAKWDFATTNASKLLDLLRIAHVAGAYKQEASPPPTGSASINQPGPIFVDKELGQRMRLFGDYYGAAKRLVKHHDFAAARQSDEITIEFIPVSFHLLPAELLMDANLSVGTGRASAGAPNAQRLPHDHQPLRSRSKPPGSILQDPPQRIRQPHRCAYRRRQAKAVRHALCARRVHAGRLPRVLAPAMEQY